MIAAAFWVQSLVWISLTICWGMWMVNANDIDSQFSDWCDAAKELMTREELSESNLPSCDVSIYDIAWVAGPFPSDTD